MTKELGIWKISVLALLREAPMHPYQMQGLLRLRHKDEILVLKRGSLYHAIGRLVKAGLIDAESTSRDGKRPERTTYRILPAGHEELMRALCAIVATPRREPSEFMAAVSFLVHLTPHVALLRLEERCGRLTTEIEHRSAALKAALAHVGRINLLESEYLVAMLRCELDWARGVAAEIRTGAFDWDIEAIIAEDRKSDHKSRKRKA
jgi:DNA-binding PadR family transcriptional regulator